VVIGGDVVLIGVESRARAWLAKLVSELPMDFTLSVIIVEHGARSRDDDLASALSAKSKLPIVRITDKDPIVPGFVYVAPPEYHVLVDRGSLALAIDPPVFGERLSVDVLFETGTSSYGAGCPKLLVSPRGDDPDDVELRLADGAGDRAIALSEARELLLSKSREAREART
jgi:two-component system chemotaxis response regulator CheB